MTGTNPTHAQFGAMHLHARGAGLLVRRPRTPMPGWRAIAIAVAMLFTTLSDARLLDAPFDDAQARLDRLRQDARDPGLPIDVRRRAAESLIASMRELAEARPDDPRRGVLLADAAEECFVTLLPLGGELDTTLFGLPTHDEWRRTSAAIALMVDLADRAEQASNEAVRRLSDPSRALGADDAALLDRYETADVPRRIPLLRGMSEAFAALVVDETPDARRARGASAIARLDPLLVELDHEALFHASCAAALAAACAGDRERTLRAIEAAREPASRDPHANDRLSMTAVLAIALLGDRRGAVDRAAWLAAPERAPRAADDADRARALAFLAARLRRDAARAGDPLDGASWSEPLRRVLELVPAPSRSALRGAILARLVDLAESEPESMTGAPLLELAATEALARRGADDAAVLAKIEPVLRAIGEDDSWRIAALQIAARQAVRLHRPAEAADRLLEVADRFRTDADAPAAMAQALVLARLVDDGVPDSVARARLRSAVELALAAYPDHPSRATWRIERVVLDAEALAAAASPTSGERARRDALAAAISAIRGPMSALPDDADARDLRARLALAVATVALDGLDGDGALEALAALDAAPAPELVPRRAEALRDRRLMALALLDRDLTADATLRSARPAADDALLASALGALQRIAPPLEAGDEPTSDAERRAAALRLVALIDSLLVAPTEVHDHSPDAVASIGARELAQLAEAEALRAVGQPAAALERFRALLEHHPDRADLLLGEAESLVALPVEAARDKERLARALANYQRLIAGREYTDDPSERTRVWWLCQWRQLECLRRAGADPEQLKARIGRLRTLDPSLGGPPFAARFAAFVDDAPESAP